MKGEIFSYQRKNLSEWSMKATVKMFFFFTPKLKPLRKVEDSEEENVAIRSLYGFNDGKKKSGKYITGSHALTATFRRFEELPSNQQDALFDNIIQQIKQKLNADKIGHKSSVVGYGDSCFLYECG